jgi:formate C-acetyltransferase
MRRFVEQNYKSYAGDASFLADATPRTKQLWTNLEHLIHEECEKGARVCMWCVVAPVLLCTA